MGDCEKVVAGLNTLLSVRAPGIPQPLPVLSLRAPFGAAAGFRETKKRRCRDALCLVLLPPVVPWSQQELGVQAGRPVFVFGRSIGACAAVHTVHYATTKPEARPRARRCPSPRFPKPGGAPPPPPGFEGL